MTATFPNGYNLLGCSLLDKSGEPLSSEDLKGYTCCQCKFVLREACQLSCGHRSCKLCVPSQAFKCKLCDETVDPRTKDGLFNDRRCQKDLKDFKVVCKCGEVQNLDPWEAHGEECQEIAKVKPKHSAQETAQILHKIRAMETDIKRSSDECIRKTDSLEKEIRSMKVVLEEVQRSLRSGGGTRQSGNGSSRHSSTDIQRKLAQLGDVTTQLVTDVEQQKGTIAQMTRSVDEVSSSVARYESILDELNLKLEILEVKSCTGQYVWKVNDLTRRKNEAKMGHTLSLYSPPFYTSEHGYRVCLRAYLNGDGSGRDTHISLYIVVMKSEFDDLLAWPFSHSVTLTLVNQVEPLSPDKSITHKFTPNPSSSSFQKPRDVFNIASGFPEFAPVTVLSNPRFTQNDTMYFRIKLDPPSVPTGPDKLEFRQR